MICVKKVISILIFIFIFLNFTINICVSSDNQADKIHLETGTSVDKFLNISDTKSHQYWIYLEYNRTYSIEVKPSNIRNDADLYFYFNGSNGLIKEVDKVSGGSTEKYEYKCSRTGKYYIEVFSNKSTDYKIIVRDITYNVETGLTLLAILVIYLWYYAFSRRKKEIPERREGRLGRFLDNEIVQFIFFFGAIASIIGMFLSIIYLLIYLGVI